MVLLAPSSGKSTSLANDLPTHVLGVMLLFLERSALPQPNMEPHIAPPLFQGYYSTMIFQAPCEFGGVLGLILETKSLLPIHLAGQIQVAPFKCEVTNPQ